MIPDTVPTAKLGETRIGHPCTVPSVPISAWWPGTPSRLKVPLRPTFNMYHTHSSGQSQRDSIINRASAQYISISRKHGSEEESVGGFTILVTVIFVTPSATVIASGPARDPAAGQM